MMVETILESSQDFGMSSGALPQWKRELLQRRLARGRGAPAAPAPPPPPLPPAPPPPLAHDEDEELRYGPGIVKRLKSRYLSLALRDAPRRRPSVLRRAASLEHMLDERPPPAPRAPARAPRPASLAASAAPHPPPAARRDSVKRARSVDALSRLESREDAASAPPSPEPRPPAPRAARPPRRVQPLLRETERPPPDVVRSTLRKFESAPPRRAAPAARASAALRGLESRRSLTPDELEPAPRDASPPPATPPPPVPAEPAAPAAVATPPKLEPVPFPASATAVAPNATPAPPAKTVETALPSPETSSPTELPSADEVEGATASSSARAVPRAALERIARAGSVVRYAFTAPHPPPLSATNPVLLARPPRRVGVIRPMPPAEREASPPPAPASARAESPERAPLVNGHSTPSPSALSRIGAAGIDRAWSGSAVKRISPAPAAAPRPSWARGAGGARPRAPPPAATSVVFNFSNRKEVPDYIENDGIILRASRRNRIKAGEVGVVVLRPELLALDTECDVEEAEFDAGPPSPCDVRFVNDNVLINGKSSMPGKHNKDRIAKLKLQFDDSLTRTFEYPSETSLSEPGPPSAPAAPSPPTEPPSPAPSPPAPSLSLTDNTHIASAALSRYTPSKTCAAVFQLGLTNPHPPASSPPPLVAVNGSGAAEGEGDAEMEEGEAEAAPAWSDARAHRTDLLF